jgi:GxxExxY protein
MLRIHSSLPDDVEELITQTIGCCITVHRELGAGLPEHAYAKALALELAAAQIDFEREKRYVLEYRGEYICDVYLDFVIANTLVLEIKSVEHLAPIHHSQTLNYMRVSRLRAGLLINFNVPVVRDGIRRKGLVKRVLRASSCPSCLRGSGAPSVCGLCGLDALPLRFEFFECQVFHHAA